LDIPKDKQFKEYTLMTYYDAPKVELPTSAAGVAGPAGSYPEFDNLSYYTSQTFMMLDIAALQQMYGANYNFRSGDNTYTWSPTTGAVYVDGVLNGVVGDGLTAIAGANKIFQTIWDGNGIDTYDLSNYSTNLKIDLRPGEHSTFSEAQRMYIGRDIDNNNFYARGNVYNTLLYNNDPRSLIENAKGGSGNDSLTGNIAENHLWGNAGRDTLTGGAADDILDGGSDFDTAVFSGVRSNYTITNNADDSFTVTDNREDGDGTDILTSINFAQFSDQVVILVDPGFTRTGSAESDRLNGDVGSDKLYGLGGNDVLNGYAGVDYMNGGTGSDTYYVDNTGDRVIEAASGGTADRVVSSISYTLGAYVEKLTGSGSVAITLTGNTLNNTITGNSAANRISGGTGNDRINGGSGDDVLLGGAGRDTSVFGSSALGYGNVDTIMDFNVQDDTIQLKFFSFSKVGTLGTLNREFFTISSVAKDRNDYIVYNKATGVVSYDVDGSGSEAAVDFLKVKAGTALTNSDFYVVY
jgi:serralysin